MYATTTVNVTASATPVTPPTDDRVGGFSFSFTVPDTPVVKAGGSGVTFATGRTLPAGSSVDIVDNHGHTLYLICDTAQSADIVVLWQGVSA